MYRVLDLFSGIGGFSLGLERTGGFKTVAFCEIDPFCRRVLAKHWPEVPCYHDVRQLTADQLRADGIVPDVITGGFPCQDISVAGKGAGLEGERSGLWSEIARLSDELRPRFVIVENVSALLGRGLERVLGDLAALGFDAEWHCIPAAAIGAPHRRDRFWLVAYPSSGDIRQQSRWRNGESGAGPPFARQHGETRVVAHADEYTRDEWRTSDADERSGRRNADRSGFFADVAQPSRLRLEIGPGTLRERAHATATGNGWWAVEPDVGRVAHGVPSRVDRLRSLGNAVVPQIPELIGRAILANETVQ